MRGLTPEEYQVVKKRLSMFHTCENTKLRPIFLKRGKEFFCHPRMRKSPRRTFLSDPLSKTLEIIVFPSGVIREDGAYQGSARLFEQLQAAARGEKVDFRSTAEMLANPVKTKPAKPAKPTATVEPVAAKPAKPKRKAQPIAAKGGRGLGAFMKQTVEPE